VLSLLLLCAMPGLFAKGVRAQPPSSAEILEAALDADAKNLARARQRVATLESARFINEHMPAAPSFKDHFALLDHSIASVSSDVSSGLWAEFGVYRGVTINHIASRARGTIHGFDSWEGLPEDWRPGYPKGTFRMEGIPEVGPNVQLYRGWFSESLPGWAESHPGHMAFIHFDADLYSSTKDVLDVIGDRIVAGTVLQFDEFLNYPGWQHGEYKAFMEWVDASGVEFEFIGYVEGGNSEQVAVRITAVAH